MSSRELTNPATARSPAEPSVSLAKAIVGVVARITGRGPTKVRVTIVDDLVCVVMHDNHTKGERALLQSGRHGVVSDLRRAYYDTMRPELLQAVQQVTGREVRAMLAAHDPGVDVSAVHFVLVPQS